MSKNHDSENSGAVDDPPIYPQSSTNLEAASIKLSHGDSRKDMFMDASEELNNDNEEAGPPITRENDGILEEKPNALARQFDETNTGGYNSEVNDNNHFVSKMEGLRILLKKAVDERRKLEIKQKEEIEVPAREMSMKDEEIERLNAKVISSVVELEAVKGVFVEKNQQYEVALKRILAALGSVVDQGDLLGDSGGEQIDVVEKRTLALIEKYKQFLFEVNQLRECLMKAECSFGVQEFGTVFVAARDELFELRMKEAELVRKIGLLEDENRKLLEQVESEKAAMELLNLELGKTKKEVEQEKMRSANAKEKLSMAVTKGKALVQQRDALKLSLVDKTSALEKYLVELQEKSGALEASELHKEELLKSESLVASLQESLSQKTLILETFEHIISQIDVPEELQSVDIVGRARWLANERNELKDVSLDFYRLKDTICGIDLPENISFSDLDSRLTWFKESFYQAKDEIKMLQNEIARTKEAAGSEIDHLNASLLTVQQEKDYIKEESDRLASKYEEIVGKMHQTSVDKDHLSTLLATELIEKDYIQKELDNLKDKYEEVVEEAQQLSSEKDQVFRLLVEGSGAVMGDQEEIEDPSSNLPMLIGRCFGKTKEQRTISLETPFVDAELFEKLQSLFYVRDLELTLCEEILEEDMLVRSQLNDLSNQLRVTSQELFALKEEKDVLQNDLERSEEKSGLLREKLSMAVKKGKGLVQDRENLKILLEEKNSEIAMLRLELQQEESAVAECRSQISTLSTDLEHIPKLESEVAAMKEERDQLEMFLFERNSILQRVVESIDHIVIPVDSAFQEPVDKLKLLAGYIDGCQTAKKQAEQELREVKEEVSNLAGKLAEAQVTTKLCEDALAVVKNDLSQLAEEKREIEFGKQTIEIELQKAIEEAHSQTKKFAETCEAKKSLEESLSQAENKISLLISEKQEVQGSRAASEMEMRKVREEVAIQTSRLTVAYNTIKSLENSLSQAEMTVASLTEGSYRAQLEITSVENELKKQKDQTETQASKLADAGTTIKSLEDALVKAENDFSVLQDEKSTADQEILSLNFKLNACMEELAGSNGSLASITMELIGHLNNLQMLTKDQSFLSRMKQWFDRNLEHVKDMDLTIKNTMKHLFDKDLKMLQGYPPMEDMANLARQFSDDIDNIVNVEMENDEVKAVNAANVSSCFRRVAEGFHLRNRILADRFEGFSNFLDESMVALLKNLQATEDEVKSMVENTESLKHNAKNMEMQVQEKEKTIAMLQNDVAILVSACTDATGDLQFDFKNNLIKLCDVPGLEKLNHAFHPEAEEFVGDDMAQQEFGDNRYAQTAKKLLNASRKVQSLVKIFETTSKEVATFIHDLQKKLKDTIKASKKSIEERDLCQSKVIKLESDVEALEDSYRKVRLKVEDYQAKEDRWKEKEAEVLLLNNSLLMKEKVAEAEEPLLSASQLRTLLDRLNAIEIPLVESEDLEAQSSADVKKLFSVIDSFIDLQNQINLLSYEKEELQSTISRQIFEIEHLKEEIRTHVRNKPDLEEMKTELFEVTFGLEKIIVLLGGKELIGGQNSIGMKALLPILEKQVNDLLLEAENSKSKAQELGTKLLGSQKVVDELSTKLKLLEYSIQSRTVQPEIIQERSIEGPSASTGSEISETEDVGSLGKNKVSLVPSAAQVRMMRKGSRDHLALNIDLESDRLVNSEETDEDKGHLFKSLNTSGCIPKQGKMIADRVDGIWVSGGQVLSSRPRARLGLVAYFLILHIWLLGTVL
ncbi:hypothetical protein PTKIN_Ptkin02bG0071400 [Pterospermum kingtungense]